MNISKIYMAIIAHENIDAERTDIRKNGGLGQ